MNNKLESPMKIQRIAYPWLGSLLLLTMACYLFIGNSQLTSHLVQTLPQFFTPQLELIIVGVAMLTWLLDLRLFYNRRENYIKNSQALKAQLNDLIENKRQLQRKAHTYSNQTEKLKAFIGDRLLEYIEYDEKFLHFKGIAAEVRHNGIICYDKILNALQSAADTEADNPIYPEALTSLSYLWDLLDLSTADNIALHINNHICECEEYYYQIQLQKQHPNSQAEPIPYTPTFLAHNALLRAILPLMKMREEAVINENTEFLFHTQADSQFQLYLSKDCELLGNENHIVLVIENLVKNALYYTNEASIELNTDAQISRAYNKVSLSLTRDAQSLQIGVYNHGPHVPAESAEQIYQLGYTTRRAKDVHGKGLGLYFVKQIVTGYEGKISHKNISNQGESYSLRLELEGIGFEGNEIQTKVIETRVDSDSIFCQNKTLAANDGEIPPPLACIDWAFKRRLVSIEITAHSNGKTFAFNQLDASDLQKFIEPGLRYAPRWALEVENKAESSHIRFLPLDITGVEFQITLPLAEYQFEQDEAHSNGLSEDYISSIEDRFKPIDHNEAAQ
ncbi:ATP-binding protein [Simiduia curdlanivorans]|uniref:histidine kinase n=1 Tax=Simiduia curdlanivorans TaxID=1492769 RepID=A0ABV8V173_9GAMM|nr:ATP-binding protein [Simiduia curdlanivorans]MDN3640363.1 ATP-binding protein [Simiduia curdlanivorans]